MIWLVLGVLLWSFVHLMKRLTPGLRASLGNGGKAVVAIGSFAAIALMVIGYRSAATTELWSLGKPSVWIADLLMIAAVVLAGAANSKSRLRAAIRHPMLTGAAVWSVAHLLVRGDLASLVLFGGLGLWSVASMRLINSDEPEWKPYSEGTAAGDIKLAVISAVVLAVLVALHIWLGPNPLPV